MVQKPENDFKAEIEKLDFNHSHELDMDSLILIAGGHSAFQLLWAGVELGLYDLLVRLPGCTQETIGRELKLSLQPTRILLTGLVALKIIIKKEDFYFNAKLTNQFLVSHSPVCMSMILGWQRYIVYEGLIDFVDSLKQNTNVGLNRFPGPGDTLYERLSVDLFREKVFQDAMSGLSSHANLYLKQIPVFNEINTLLDAGGGDGTNAIKLCENFSRLNVTVFDSETVCNLANEKVSKMNMSNRVNTKVGDFLTDELPLGYDAILYCHILTIWSPEKNLVLLRKTYEALPKNGCIIIFNMVANDDGSGPLSTALGSPYFQAIATGGGMLYTWSDYIGWLQEVGFRSIEKYDRLPLNHGVIVGRK